MSITPGQTGLASDFIVKSERNATPANDSGRVAQLEADGFLDLKTFIKNSKLYTAYETLDGSATPIAVALAGDGTLLRCFGNATDTRNFIGFVNTNNVASQPTLVNSASSTSATTSFGALAGTNRILIVQVNVTNSVALTATPSGVTWNGAAMNLIGASPGTGSGISFWWIALGTNLSTDTHNIVVTGGTNFQSMFAYNVANVAQSSPVAASNFTSVSINSVSHTLTPTQAISFAIQGICSRTGNAITVDGSLTVDMTEGTSRKGAHLTTNKRGTSDLTLGASGTGHTGTEQLSSALVILKNFAAASNIEVYEEAVISGFSGLTDNFEAFVTDAGAISSTPGTYHIRVGRAVSATQVFAKRSPISISGTLAMGTATASFRISTSFLPKRISIAAFAAETTGLGTMKLEWSQGVFSAIAALYNEATTGIAEVSANVYDATSGNFMTVTIASVGADGFTITLTETGTFAGGVLVYEVSSY